MYKIIGADGKEYGPIAADVLQQWIAEGRADGQTRVLAEGSAEWKPLVDFPEFSAALAATSTATPSPITPFGQQPRNNPLAITGMIMGILALPMGCCCYGLPFNVLGIIFSAIALSQIKQDPLSQQGRGMAIAGLVLSILSIVLAVVVLILGFAVDSSGILRRLQQMR